MDTNKLIQELSAEPVGQKRLKSTPQATAVWLVVGTAFMAVLGGSIGLRDDVGHLLVRADVLTEIALLALSACVSSYVALDLRYPQTPILLKNKALLSIAGLIWVYLIAQYLHLFSSTSIESVKDELSHVVNSCMVELCLVSILPIGYIAYLSKKGATTNRGVTGLSCTMAAASLGALLMRLLCPNDSHEHLLLWHYIPVLVLAAIGAIAGRSVFRW